MNDSEQPRVILFADVFHPELSPGERRALSLFERRRAEDEDAYWSSAAPPAPPEGVADLVRLARSAGRD